MSHSTPAAETQRPTTRAALLLEHERLDGRMHDLARMVDAGDAAAVVPTFRAFERTLLEHLAYEEKELLPAFADLDAREADGIRAEHAAIRARVDELGMRAELHTLRASDVHALIAALRDHAAREEAVFYGWVETRGR